MMIGIHTLRTLPDMLVDVTAATTPVETIQMHKTPRTNSVRIPTRAVGPRSSRNVAFFLVHGEDSRLPRARC